MAIAVGPRPQEFGTQAEVQSQVRCGLPVVLGKNGGIVLPVFVIVDAAATEAEGRRALHKILEIGQAVGRVGEEELPVKDLRKQLVQIDADKLTSEGEGVRSVDPTQVFHKVKVVLCLELIGRRRWAELESGSQKREFVDALREVAVGRSMPASLAVTGLTLMPLLLMRTKPKRKSLTSVGEKR